MTEIGFITFFKKSNPTKFHNYFAEYFRASSSSMGGNVDSEGFNEQFVRYLSTRKKGEEFNPSMQSWHKYLKDIGLDNRPTGIRCY